MLIPILPLYLRESGLSYTSVSTVLAAVGFGSLVSQIPMGAFVARFGQRTVMLIAHLVIGVSVALLGVVSVTIALVSLRFVSGVGTSAWFLSRHSFLTSNVSPAIRGRASSVFGGTTRFGVLIGPLLGGAIAARWGFTAAFAVTGLLSALGVVPMLFAAVAESATETVDRQPLMTVIRERWRSLLAVGTVQFGFITVRTGRYAVIPFLGAAIGLSVSQVGALVAFGSAAELVLFPLAGWLMDRYGRLAAVVPSLLVFSAGLVLAGLARTVTSLFVAAAVIGLGNGLGAGTMITIGSDLAPQDHPAGFLSVTGMMRETGRVLGPLLVGWFGDAIGLGASAYALAVVAALTALFTWRVLGDTRAG
jgi:MFS family permease